ncbi:MAG: hypothetical protein M1833_000583 [Piccolia ochrophora]|nr:MAG: hypothetical protein M1833_000583 [Piccolia ochrophora]
MHSGLWSSHGHPDPRSHPAVSQSMPAVREYCQMTAPSALPTAHGGLWGQPKCEETYELDRFVTDFNAHSQDLVEQEEGILDLRFRLPDIEEDRGKTSRRMSGSSFSVSSCEAAGEKQPSEDKPAVRDLPSDMSAYTTRNLLSSTVTTSMSPTSSPQAPLQRKRALTGGHPRTSRSPRPNVRSVPYPMGKSRHNRWSTGSFAPAATQQSSSYPYPPGDGASSNGVPHPTQNNPPATQRDHLGLSYGNPQAHQTSYYTPPAVSYPSNDYFQPSAYQSQYQQSQAPPPLMSHGYFRMLQSNADAGAHQHYHYADLSDPPDLSACLHDEQVQPPPEDMNPSDPDLVPHEQELRFDGDLYTPRWVRGHGNKREGWCGICKPGRWLVLKNSAFWYDKSFSHGISAASGNQFQAPQRTRRMDGNPDVWEGLCGSCNEWIALVSSKKKGTTWWRHCYKCHTHQKVKDAPKKRREGSHSRVSSGGGGNTTKPTLSTSTSMVNQPELAHSATPGMTTSSPLELYPQAR